MKNIETPDDVFPKVQHIGDTNDSRQFTRRQNPSDTTHLRESIFVRRKSYSELKKVNLGIMVGGRFETRAEALVRT